MLNSSIFIWKYTLFNLSDNFAIIIHNYKYYYSNESDTYLNTT